MRVPTPRSQRGFTIVELLTVIAIVTVLLALLTPSIVQTQEDARRTQCRNRLKQLGLGLHNYHDTHVCFPPGWTNHFDAPGSGTRFGWLVFLTPYMDQAPLYQKLEFNRQIAEPKALFQTKLAGLRCPSDSTADANPLRGNFGTSNYSGNFGDKAAGRWAPGGLAEFWPGQPATPTKTSGVFYLNSKVRIRDMSDGTTNCMMAGERSVTSGAGIWMGVRGNDNEDDQVTDSSFGNEINSGYGAFSSRHPGGSQIVLGDGSVRFVSEKIQSAAGVGPEMGTYQRLSHIADSNVLGEY